MTRAILVALGLSLVLLWLVGVVDQSTIWMTWLDGTAAVLTFWLVPVTRPHLGPIEVATGPALIGCGLGAVFVVGLLTGASAWLTWFNLAFAGGYLMFAGFAFLVRVMPIAAESRRPIARF
jgi:hypothetical protein